MQIASGAAAGIGVAGIMPLISEGAQAAAAGGGLAFGVWNMVPDRLLFHDWQALMDRQAYGLGMASGPILGGA
jgi:hypothetical protein